MNDDAFELYKLRNDMGDEYQMRLYPPVDTIWAVLFRSSVDYDFKPSAWEGHVPYLNISAFDPKAQLKPLQILEMLERQVVANVKSIVQNGMTYPPPYSEWCAGWDELDALLFNHNQECPLGIDEWAEMWPNWSIGIPLHLWIRVESSDIVHLKRGRHIITVI